MKFSPGKKSESASPILAGDSLRTADSNHVYKNFEAQKCPFFKNIIVISLVAISISFEPQDEF